MAKPVSLKDSKELNAGLKSANRPGPLSPLSFKGHSGATKVEYGLLVSLVAGVIAGLVGILGTTVRDMLTLNF